MSLSWVRCMINIFAYWPVFILFGVEIEIHMLCLLLQKQKCPYSNMRADLHEKLKKIENVDTVVNLSIAVMILVVMVSSSLL